MRETAPLFRDVIDDAAWSAAKILHDVSFACNRKSMLISTILFAFALVSASVCRAHGALSEGTVVPSVHEHKRLSFISTVLLHFLLMCRAADIVNFIGHDSMRDLENPMLISLWQRLEQSSQGTNLIYHIIGDEIFDCVLDVLRMAPHTQCGALLGSKSACQIVPECNVDFVVMKPQVARNCAVFAYEAQERVLHTMRRYARTMNESEAESIMRRLPVWNWVQNGEWFGTWALSGRSVVRASTISALLNLSIRILMSAKFVSCDVKNLCLTRAVCVAFVNGYAMQARALLECAASNRYKLCTQGIMLNKHEMGGRHVIGEPVTPLMAALLAENDDCIRIARKPPLFLRLSFLSSLELLQQYLRIGCISNTIFACASFANRVQHLVKELPPCASMFKNLYESFLRCATCYARSKKLQVCFAAAKGYIEGGGDLQALCALAMTTEQPDFAGAGNVLLGNDNTMLSSSWKKVAHILFELSRERACDGTTVGHAEAMLQSCDKGTIAVDRHVFELSGVALPQYMCTTKCCKIGFDKTLQCSYDASNSVHLQTVVTTTRNSALLPMRYPTNAQLPAVWTAIVIFAGMDISAVPE